jgi:hypothetical protein
MKVLKRKYARIVVGLSMAALLAFGFALAFRKNPMILRGSLVVLVVSVLAIAFIRWRYLRCPHCGKSAAIVYWGPGWNQSCPKCHERIYFDDEQ